MLLPENVAQVREDSGHRGEVRWIRSQCSTLNRLNNYSEKMYSSKSQFP